MLPVATTRPELLAACVAVFVHPGDSRYAIWWESVRVPLFGQACRYWLTAADPKRVRGRDVLHLWRPGRYGLVEAHHLPLLWQWTGWTPDRTGRPFARSLIVKPGKEIERRPAEQGLLGNASR